jgi:hypothetical protein
MNSSDLEGTVAQVRAVGRAQAVIRLVVALAPMVAVGASFAAGHQQSWWVMVAVAACSVSCAVRPETNVGLLVVVIVGWCWVVTVDDLRTPWTLVAAVALGVFHMSCAAATVGHPASPWSAPMRARWVRRSAIVIGVTALAWLAELGLTADRPGGNAALLLIALLSLTVVTLILRARAVGR